MNLSTARAATRAKEVGMRKVVGARRDQLIAQFLGESVLITLIALTLGTLGARFILPIFYEYMDKELAIDFRGELFFLLILLALGATVGILAGSYPSFVLSRFNPVQVLRGIFIRTQQGTLLRKGLVVFQFLISALFIMLTLTLYKQLNFMQSYSLGFDQERVLVIPPNTARALASEYSVIKTELLSLPQVVDVTMSSGVPGQGASGDMYVASEAPPESAFGMAEVFVDYNAVDLFRLEMIAGRNFSETIKTDAGIVTKFGRPLEVTAILNETAVRKFGWRSAEEALGKQVVRDPNAKDWTANVIGVVKDFHFQSLREEILPLALILRPDYRFLSIKLRPGNPQPTIAAVERKIKEFAPDTPFEYNFLDEAFKDQYEMERKIGEVFSYISILAILIASLGLFGLAAFMTSQRIKEIGIRKTLGAGVSNLVVLLSREFVKLVIIAVLIAIPIAYYLTEMGLEYFAYRIKWTADVYLLAFGIALLIAICTITFHTFKAAMMNPVESLRSE